MLCTIEIAQKVGKVSDELVALGEAGGQSVSAFVGYCCLLTTRCEKDRTLEQTN